MDRFGPDNFSTLQIKGHVLHRARAHLKVPGWLLVWNALPTKKLPMFLSCFNEISGGCEKILPVSGSFWSNLMFFRMMDFTAWLWGWNVSVHGIRLLFSFWDVCRLPISLLGAMVACLNNRSRIATFVEEMAQLIWFQGKIRVLTTKATKSKKLRIRNRILDMWWMWRWTQQITMRICGFVVHTGA